MADVKWRDRKMILVLYPDCEEHINAMKIITESYSFAGILHDKDTYDEDDKESDSDYVPGALKKPHWHILLRFGNAVWNTAVAEQLGIAPNYIRKCVSFDSYLLYLIHYNNPEKAQYEYDEVFGPLRLKLAALLASQDDEGTQILQIVNMIDSCPRAVRYRDVLVDACKAGLWSQFRRLGVGVKFLIDEHNYDVCGGDDKS